MSSKCFKFGFLGFGSLLVLGGCTQANRPDVPSGAMQVSSGSKVVAFTAPHDGKAYLRDDSNNRVVYSTDLKRDQVMRFDPALDIVRIDGNTAPEGIDNPNHDHSIYFVRFAPPDRADVIINDTKPNNASDNTSNTVPIVRVPIGVDVSVQTRPSTPN